MNTPTQPAPLYFRDVYPTEHICADDLRGQNHTVEIERVDPSGQYWNNRRRVPCIVLYFKGKKKGLRLNTTNHNTIAFKLGYGKNLAEWVGKRIVIYPSTDDNIRGPDKACVRVREQVPPTTPASE